ncbi:mechanosensitive ion channel domain-containing protein [Oceanibaculum nanhaiense]|uniref:mechanosensitive ion channel domain-containing protein n=1 Tax=Oceanibaculum nanhaiense TaxID=1909734 RepID=UPI003F717DB7
MMLSGLRTVLFAWILACAVLAPAAVALAQQAGQAQESAQVPGQQELQKLADTLKDDQKRQALIGQIEALVKVQGAGAEPDRPVPVSSLLGRVSERIGVLSGALVQGIEAVFNYDRVLDWGMTLARDEQRRERLLLGLAKILVVVLSGYVAYYVVRLLFRRLRRQAAEKETQTRWLSWLMLLVRGVFDLIPVLAFFGAAQAVIVLAQMPPSVRLASVALIFAFVVYKAVMAAIDLLLSPQHRDRRHLRITDETAAYLHVWLRRFTITAVFGLFAVEAAVPLGLPDAVADVFVKLIYIVLAVMAVIFVLQNRKPVAEALRGVDPSTAWQAEGDAPQPELPAAARAMRRVRRRIAGIWHFVALLYIFALFGILIMDVQGGFAFLIRATLVSCVILVLARLVWTGIDRLVTQLFSVSEQMRRDFPSLEDRANRYVPVLSTVLHAIVAVIATVALLQVWGLDAFAYVTSSGGQRFVTTVVTILIILGVAAAIWEAVSLMVERYLKRLDDQGQTSTRAKTLLPLVRNALMIVLITLVTLIILSELGVNIAPLLAGAGVIGLAIGFGSQALVKDVITGLFLLVEDTINVGDVVQVGSQSGVVEGMSIRAIRLRDLGGNVHVIPFGSVDIITNMTKDFGRAVVDVGIGYRENVDDVIEVLRKIGEELAEDENFKANITAPMEIFGVQSLGDSAVVIRCRFTTKAGMQWAIEREMNRRVKNRFDELGIEIPFPHQTLYFGVDKDGGAPPARLLIDRAKQAKPVEKDEASLEAATSEAKQPKGPPPEMRDAAAAKVQAAKEEVEDEKQADEAKAEAEAEAEAEKKPR